MFIRELDAERRELLIAMGFSDEKKLINLNGYPAVHVSRGGKKGLRYVHRMVAEFFLGAILERSTFVHHKDEDKWNFRIANLHVCSHAEHNAIHRRFGKDNHFFGRKHSDKSRKKMSEALVGRIPTIMSDVARDKMSRSASLRPRHSNGTFLKCN